MKISHRFDITDVRCDGCKYWDAEAGKRQTDGIIVGLCKRSMPLWDATMWDPMPSPGGGRRILRPEFSDRRFFAQDGSDYRAEVYTSPSFFCADWLWAKA